MKNGIQWAISSPCKENKILSQFILCKILLATDGRGWNGVGWGSWWKKAEETP